MDITRSNFFAVTLAILSIVGISVLSSTNLMLVSILCVLGITLFSVTNIGVTIFFVMLASTMNGMSDLLPSVFMRPEYFSIIIGVAAILIYAIIKRGKIHLPFELYVFIVFITYTFVISMKYSPVPDISIRGIIQLIFAFTACIIIYQLQEMNKNNVITMVKGYVIIGVIQSIYGIISFIVYQISRVDLGGLMFGQGAESVTLKGTFIEANLFGSFIGVTLLLAISLLIFKLVDHPKLWILLSILLFLGLLLSWTRSAWIGFVMGLTIVAVLTYKKFFTAKNLMIFIAIIVIVIIPCLFVLIVQFDSASDQSGLFLSKFENLFNSKSGTGLYRVNQFQTAIQDVKGYEIFGKGYFSIKAYGETAWISNIFIFIFHDSGIIGLTLFLVLLISVIIKGIVALKNTKDSQYRVILVALLSGLGLYMFSFNFTPGHTLSMFWVHLGIVLAVANKSKVARNNVQIE